MVALLKDIEYIFDLVLHFLVELNGLVSVNGMQGIANKLVDVGNLINGELLEHIFPVKY